MQFQLAHPFKCFDPEVVEICGKYAIGSTGAVGTKTGGKGIALTRTGVGLYTLQLKDSKSNSVGACSILHVSVAAVVNDSDPSNDTTGHMARVLSITDSSGAITLAMYDEALSVKELPSGALVTFSVKVKRSNLTR